jgi:HD-GYP domain-containing protein (c-di-GMP phosphodiesterase class II)
MEDRDDIELTKHAKDIINNFAVILRSAQIHDTSNVAVVSSINRFVTMINHLIKSSGAISVELVGEYFFVNENRVKIPSEYMASFDFLAKEFAARELGSVTFNEPVGAQDMQLLVKAFVSSATTQEPFDAIVDGVKASPRLIMGKVRIRQEDEGEFDARKAVKKTYFNAVTFTKGVMKKMGSGEKVSVKRAKRVVQSMVDQLLEEHELLLGMTAIKDYDDYTYHHSVNVSILSVALGQQIGFPKRVLLDLGLAALFHDIGKLDIPPEVLNKPSEFTEEEWATVKRHPFWGVKSILDIKGFDQNAILSAIVAFEHHIHHDNTGYPRRKTPADRDLYSKIVSIVDQYDGMTSARVYARTPLTPDRSLKLMLSRSGSQLDPILMKYFINMIGIYPVGSLVMLDTRELGLVYGPTNVPGRPKVLIIVNSKGQKIEGTVVDLNEELADGRYKRSILRTMDPNKYKINLAEYML